MPARFFLTGESPSYSPPGYQGGWTGSSNLQQYALATISTVAHFATTHPSSSARTYQLDQQYIGEPLEAAGTLSGTFTVTASWGTANSPITIYPRVYVWVSVGDSMTVRGVLVSDTSSGSLIGSFNSNTPRAIGPVTVSDVAVQVGDRIIVEVGEHNTNATTNANAPSHYTGGLGSEFTWLGQTTQTFTVDGVPWVEFSDPNKVLNQKRARFYPHGTTASYTGTTVKGTYTATGSPTTQLTLGVTKGPSTSIGYSGSNAGSPIDLLMRRFVSPPAAVGGTITGYLRGITRLNANNGGGTWNYKLTAWVTQGNSNTVRGYLLQDAVLTPNLTLASPTDINTVAISSVTLQAGDRIVLEMGARATGAANSYVYPSTTVGGTGSPDQGFGGSSTDPIWIELTGDTIQSMFPEPLSVSGSSAGIGSSSGVVDVASSGTTHDAAGTSEGSGSSSGSATEDLFGAGSSAGAGSSSGSTTATRAGAGTSTGVGSSTGVAAVSRSTSGTSAGVGSTNSTPQVTRPAAGTSAGLGSSSGSLAATRSVSGTSAGQGSSTGSAIAGGDLDGVSPGAGASAGSFALVRSTTGTSTGVGASTGSLARSFSQTGISAGTGGSIGAANVSFSVSGMSAGTGGSSGLTTRAMSTSGTSAGQGSTSGSVLGGGDLAGTSAGSGSSAGALVRTVAQLGTSAHLGASTGSLVKTAAGSGQAAGVGATTGALGVARVLVGAAAGQGSTSGGLQVGLADRYVHRPSTGTVDRPDNGRVTRPAVITI